MLWESALLKVSLTLQRDIHDNLRFFADLLVCVALGIDMVS